MPKPTQAVAGGGLVLIALCACRLLSEPEEIKEIRQHPKRREASPVVAAPRGARYGRAQVISRYEPGDPRYSWAARAEHTLVLDDGGAGREIQVGYRSIIWPNYTSQWKGFLEWADGTHYTISFAPDGHALGVSSDDGTRFHYVALDLPTPTICPHRTFALPWLNAPSTRTLVLEILASSRGDAAAHTDQGGQSIAPAELSAAWRYACDRPTDDELAAALVRAATRRGIELWLGSDPDWEALEECLGRLSSARRALHHELLATVASPDVEEDYFLQRGTAAGALAASDGDSAAQDAVARALLSEVARPGELPRACELRAQLAFALARITTSRRAASAVTVAALEAIVLAPEECRSNASGRIARVHGIRGLAAIPDREARAFLERLAQPGGSVAWPTEFRRWKEIDVVDELDPACWAATALRPSGDVEAQR